MKKSAAKVALPLNFGTFHPFNFGTFYHFLELQAINVRDIGIKYTVLWQVNNLLVNKLAL